jgi:hypothetical protein
LRPESCEDTFYTRGEGGGEEEVEVMRSNGLVGIPKSEEAKTNVGEDSFLNQPR